MVVDGSSRYIVIATRSPARVVVLDAATLSVVAVESVPGSARHLELAGPEAVIVPGEDTDELAVLAIPSGRVLSEVRVGRQPHDAQQLPDGVIVTADEFGNAVTATRGAGTLGTLGGLLQPGGVAQSDGLAAVVEVRGRLLDVIGAEPLRRIARLAVGAGPTHAVGLGAGDVAVADTAGNRVYVVRITGKPAVLGSVRVPGQPYGMAVDLVRQRLWVAGSGNNMLYEFSFSTSTPALINSFHTVQQPNSIAVVPRTGQLVAVGATDPGAVELVTP